MEESIPRIFHFVFGLRPQTEPFHLAHYLCLASCFAVNRPERICFHYEHQPYGPWWERIKDKLELHKIEPDAFIAGFQYADEQVARYRYAHLSDITRLQILLQHGGVYADIDTIFIRPLPQELFAQSCVMGRERVDWSAEAARQAGGSLCNAFIMAEPGAPFIQAWLEQIRERFDGSWSAHSTFLPFRLSQELPHVIRVEPETSFFALDWSKRGVRQLFTQTAALPETAYSLHLWSHLWWERDRVSHTYFHAGCLTPGYVAHAAATYSRLARPYLPDETVVDKAVYEREQWRHRFETAGLWLRAMGKRLLRR